MRAEGWALFLSKYIPLILAAAAGLSALYLLRLAFSAVLIYHKVGWGDFSLVYMMFASLVIFTSYTTLVAAASAVLRCYFSSPLISFALIESVLVLLLFWLMVLTGLIGLI